MENKVERPFAPSCERNSAPILEVLKEYIDAPLNNEKFKIFEIGSGTGQHASYMAKELIHVDWHCSDVVQNHEGINSWVEGIDNIYGPHHFEIGVNKELPEDKIDMVFSSNVLHIINWKLVKTLFKVLGKSLAKDSLVLFYGPFNYHGEYTSEGNERLDEWLKEKFQGASIRNFEDVNEHMSRNGFILKDDVEMPANNRTLVFQKL